MLNSVLDVIKTVLLVAILVYCLLVTFYYVFQRQLIYFPDRNPVNREQSHASDMSIVTLNTKDGLSLLSWYKKAEHNQPTILLFHGNAGNIRSRVPLARAFMDQGLGVLLLEYRGYGGNPGQPTEKGLYQDAWAGMEFLKAQGISSKQVIVYGESLGTGVATKIATELPVCAVVLQSPYTSLKDIARVQYPWIFLSPWDTFDSFSRIRDIRAPLLILHGDRDPVVPFSQGRALYEHANSPKIWVKLSGKGHNGLWDAQFIEHVLHFIKTRSCSMLKDT